MKKHACTNWSFNIEFKINIFNSEVYSEIWNKMRSKNQKSLNCNDDNSYDYGWDSMLTVFYINYFQIN